MTTGYRNQLLARLDPSDLVLLQSSLVLVPLAVGADLETPGGRIGHLYFPEDGIVSIVASMPPGRDIEVGIVGRDGVVGASILLDDDSAVHKAYVQIAGTAHRLSANVLLRAADASPGLRRLLLRYLRAFGVQVAGTALVNGHSKLEERLARWLVMCQDRLDTDTLALTHQFLSVMLGVRRSGVTVALQTLEGKGAIRSLRGRIVIRDRNALLEFAKGGYGQPEQEYERLMAEPDQARDESPVPSGLRNGRHLAPVAV